MVMFHAKIDTKDLDSIIRDLANPLTPLNMPQALNPVIPKIGQAWHNNFASNGGTVGGWKALKPSTIETRKQRGYGTRYLLHQSGALERGAIDPFRVWGMNQTSHRATIAPTPNNVNSPTTLPKGWEGLKVLTYGGNSGGAQVTASTTSRRFRATISGEKAVNQTGGKMQTDTGKWTTLPARPFWFLNQQMLDAGIKGVVDRFMYYNFRYTPRVTGINAVSWTR